jgi:hypothetical protein
VKIIPTKIVVLVIFIILFTNLNNYAQENYIDIVIPEEMETTTTLKRYRLAANTLSNSTVKINGKKVKVYPSGAFVDLMTLSMGENKFEIESLNKGRKVTKNFVIINFDGAVR